MIAALTPLLTSMGPLALLLVALLVLLESGVLLGIVLPGDSLLFTAGVLTAAHAISVPWWLTIAVIAGAACLGDQIGYLTGRHVGLRAAGGRLLTTERLARTQAFFDRHGTRAVVLARFVPVVRTVTPLLAGVGAMPRRRFTAYNVTGAVLWSALVVTAGLLLGGVPWVANHVELIAVGLVLLSIGPAAIGWLVRRLRPRHLTFS